MLEILYITLIIISAFILSFFVVPLMMFVMSKLAKFAETNERSNHEVPVPTGIGAGFIMAASGFMVIAHAPAAIVGAMLLLCAIGFLDDWRGLSVRIRFAVMILAVAMGMTALKGAVFQGLVPMWADLLLAGVLWLWIVNLTNFMDGIDEITTGHIITLCIGLIVISQLHEQAGFAVTMDAMILIACLLPFWLYNKHPAHCFMGDAGSLPLGFVSAYLLLHLATQGLWEAALILPAYYLTDATLTLLMRAMRGEKIWQAHSRHFYQQAVRGGRSHAFVARSVMGFNLLMIPVAVAVDYAPQGWMPVAGAYGAALMLCLFFSRQKVAAAYGA